MSALSPRVYKDILRTKTAYAFDVGGFLMRFYCYMTNIGVVTMLTLSGRSFLVAGLVSSLIALVAFVASPRISKMIDERGQSRVVPFAALVCMVGMAGMLACVVLDAPTALLFPCALLMGCMPNPPALVRARWTYLIRTGKLGTHAPDIRAVFSYEGVIDDVGFMLAPPLSITLAASIAPIAGMVMGSAAFILGTVVLTASRATEPKPGWSAVEEASAGAGDSAVDAADGIPASDDVPTGVGGSGADGQACAAANGTSPYDAALHDTSKTVIRTSPVVRVLFAMMLCVGAFYGLFDTAAVSIAQVLGDPNIASIVLALSCGVSVVSGIVFGMVRLPFSQSSQLVLAGSLLGLAYGAMFLIDSALSLYLVGAIAAVFYAPFLITANATCEWAVPGHRFTESITWVNAGMTCGMALGPTLAGVLIDVFGPAVAFDMGAVMALALFAIAVLSRGLLKRSIPSGVDVHFARKG